MLSQMHEISQLKMVHLAHFIQIRNPMKNMKKMYKFNKNIKKQQLQKSLLFFSISKNSKTKKYTKKKQKA